MRRGGGRGLDSASYAAKLQNRLQYLFEYDTLFQYASQYITFRSLIDNETQTL